MKPLQDEDKRDALQEIIHSHGWSVLLKDVFLPLLGKYTTSIFAAVRSNGNVGEIVGKYDGALALLESIYDAADVEHPDFFSNVKRNNV